MYRSVYFDSWASVWTSNAAAMDLALLLTKEPSVNIVNLAFANPTGTYTKGSFTFANTGLQFSQDFMVVKAAIKTLTSNHCKVVLSVGGADYPYRSSAPYANYLDMVTLANDLGCTGIDIDWYLFMINNDFIAFSTCSYNHGVVHPYCIMMSEYHTI